MAKVEFIRVETVDKLDNIDVKDGQLLYVKNGKTFMDYGDERIPTGSGGSDIVIGTEADVTEDTKILIDTGELGNLGSEVVNTLSGNETYKAPSVRAVNSIIESGESENGSYIKYVDGTMICRGTAIISITTNAWGSLHVCDWGGNISFPENFISKPTINANSTNNSGAISKVIATSSAITAISIFRGTSATNVDYAIDYIAIGNWK